jgi:hypothetical protein
VLAEDSAVTLRTTPYKIGIHGPLGGVFLIGKTGAQISPGCVRLPGLDLLKLRDVPPGTPISIVD